MLADTGGCEDPLWLFPKQLAHLQLNSAWPPTHPTPPFSPGQILSVSHWGALTITRDHQNFWLRALEQQASSCGSEAVAASLLTVADRKGTMIEPEFVPHRAALLANKDNTLDVLVRAKAPAPPESRSHGAPALPLWLDRTKNWRDPTNPARRS
jgi:hypothetical protein